MASTTSIAELRRITQASKAHKRAWHYRMARAMSVYITWVLIRLGVTANQVTVASIAVALLGGGALLQASSAWAITGLLLFWAYFVLDKVDGEIARFHQNTSLKGICLDYIGHLLVPGVLAFSYSGFLALVVGNHVFWIIGFGAALAQTLLRAISSIPLRMILIKTEEVAEDVAKSDDIAKANAPALVAPSSYSLFFAKRMWMGLMHISIFQLVVIMLFMVTVAFAIYDDALIICVVVYLVVASLWIAEGIVATLLLYRDIDRRVIDTYDKLMTDLAPHAEMLRDS